MKRQTLLLVTFVMLIPLIAFVLAHAASIAPPQVAIAPGSAANGARLFEQKECLRCHAFAGKGGRRASDLAQRSERAYTPALLAGVMWNHSPDMWAAFGASATRPQLSSTETADLFAYFYSTFYFTVPGDAGRGKVVFEEKNCAGCHAPRNPDRASKAKPIEAWTSVKDPVTWAERMWNHSSEMQQEMTRLGLSWPQMSGQNIVDLLVYVRSLPAARSQNASFQSGEPPLGRVVFERACEQCHTFGTAQPGKVDLANRPGPRSLTDYIASMWNHAPRMRSMSARFEPLAPGDMTNLMSYLYSQRYFFEKGDVQRGARVYRAKNCFSCHEEWRATTGAPDLAQATELYSPITMAAAVWRHGPAMFDTMKRQRIRWPEFHGSEMSNLIAYLNSRVNPKIAPVKP